MRLFVTASILVLAALIDMHGSQAEAQRRGRWCQLDQTWTAVNCSFRSFRQCQETVRGVGGICQRNPRADEPRARRIYR